LLLYLVILLLFPVPSFMFVNNWNHLLDGAVANGFTAVNSQAWDPPCWETFLTFCRMILLGGAQNALGHRRALWRVDCLCFCQTHQGWAGASFPLTFSP
jgi:hypothetical protein